MTINLKTRQVVVTCSYPNGSNPLEIQPQLLNLVLSNSQLDESGIIRATGALTLAARRTVGFGEQLDPRLNPRWSRGSILTLDIRDTTNTLRRHPRGYLRILQPPAPPNAGDLQLEVGCPLAYLDYPAPKTSPFNPPQSLYSPTTRRDQIINYLASITPDWPQLIDEIPEWPLTMGQIPSLGDKSRVTQLGQIAYAAGYVLWCNGLGQLRAKKLDLDQSPIATLDRANDAAFYEYRLGEQVSAEIVQVTSLQILLRTANDSPPIPPRITSDATYSPAELINTSLVGATTPNPTYNQNTFKPIGILFPDSSRINRTLIPASQETKNEYFSTAEDGRILREIQQFEEPLGLTLPGFYPGRRDSRVSKQVETYYEYEDLFREVENAQGTLRRVYIITYEQRGVVDPSSVTGATSQSLAASARELIPSLIESTTWQRYAKSWLQLFQRSDFRTKTTESVPTIVDSPPPAPKYRQYPTYTVQELGRTELRFSQIVGPTGDNRPINYQLPPTVNSRDHLLEHAARLGKLLYARTQPITFVTALLDTHLTNYTPLQTYDWIDGGVTGRYLANGDSWELTPTETSFGTDGLFLGAVQGSTIRPPYRIPLQAQIRSRTEVSGDLTVRSPARLSGNIISQPSLSGSLNSVVPVFGGTLNTLTTLSGNLTVIGGPAPAFYYVNCGSNVGYYVDPYEATFVADTFNTCNLAPCINYSTEAEITNTAFPELEILFKTARVGRVTYFFDIQPGSYSMLLGFAEIQTDLPGFDIGSRQFDVYINGDLFDTVDPYALAGDFNRAVFLSFVVSSEGTIQIQLVPNASSTYPPLISLIAIV